LNFFTNGLMLTLVPRLPEIKQAFELSDDFYGIVVAAMGAGALVVGPLPARFIARHGALKVALVSTIGAALMLALASGAASPLAFAVAFFLMGVLDAHIDAAQNTQGVAVQIWAGRTIMSSLHATWSVGATVATLAGSLAAGLRVPLAVHGGVMAATIIVLALACYRMGVIPPDVRLAQLHSKQKADQQAPANWRRLLPVLPLALLGVVGVVPEDATNNWAALYLVDHFGLGYSPAGMAVTVMLVAQVIGRLLSDPLADRYGQETVASVGGGLVAAGALVVIATPVAPLVYVGLVLIGVGCAPIVPTAFSAAGRLPGLASGTGISLVGFALRLGLTLNSPLMGAVAERSSVRAAFGIVVIAGLAACLLAWRYRPRH
jgi:hypothetical protein